MTTDKQVAALREVALRAFRKWDDSDNPSPAWAESFRQCLDCELAACQPAPAPVAGPCRASSQNLGFVCTLLANHDGPHRAVWGPAPVTDEARETRIAALIDRVNSCAQSPPPRGSVDGADVRKMVPIGVLNEMFALMYSAPPVPSRQRGAP